MKVLNIIKLVSITMLVIVGLAACDKKTSTETIDAPKVVGAWRCNNGVEAKDIAYFSDNTFVSHPQISNQNTDVMFAGRYKLDGQRLSETTMAARYLKAPSELLPLYWIVYPNNPPQTYPTYEYLLMSWTDRQLIIKSIRSFNSADRDLNSDDRDLIEVNPDAPLHTCEKADQLYKQFESIRAEIPPKLL